MLSAECCVSAQILSRMMTKAPLLIGEPGVGKTAVIEGLAQRIVEVSAGLRAIKWAHSSSPSKRGLPLVNCCACRKVKCLLGTQLLWMSALKICIECLH